MDLWIIIARIKFCVAVKWLYEPYNYYTNPKNMYDMHICAIVHAFRRAVQSFILLFY